MFHALSANALNLLYCLLGRRGSHDLPRSPNPAFQGVNLPFRFAPLIGTDLSSSSYGDEYHTVCHVSLYIAQPDLGPMFRGPK